jgi:predicted DCC family thiol-disulfide oxidoreductase YuxK
MFYDGSCPLCSREVAHYRRLDQEHRVDWVDISREPERLDPHGIGYETAMQRLHALDSEGRVRSGVSAFVEIWHQLPRYRYLALGVERMGLTPLLDRLYGRFAAWRLRRRCDTGTCAL